MLNYGLTGLPTLGRAVSSMSPFHAKASLHRAATWKAHLVWLCVACTLPAQSISFSWLVLAGGAVILQSEP